MELQKNTPVECVCVFLKVCGKPHQQQMIKNNPSDLMLLTDRPNRGIFWSKEGLHTVYGALSQKYYTANCSTDYSVKIYYKRSLFFS